MSTIKSHLRKLCTEVSRHSKFSFPLALAIETVSSLQIIHIILASTFDDYSTGWFPFSGFFRDITAYAGAIDAFGEPVSTINVKILWFIFIGYIALHIICFLAMVIFIQKKHNIVKEILLKVMGIVYPLHSRIIFFMIQYFLIAFIRAYMECDTDEEGLFYCSGGMAIVSGLVCVLNTFLASIVEIFFYDINKVKNPAAVKTNSLHQMELFHKLVSIFTYVLVQGHENISSLGAIVHILLTLGSTYILFTKLPFYKTILLKAKVAIMGVTMSCSVILIIRIFSVDVDLLEIPWIMTSIWAVKLYLVMFNYELKTILDGKIDKPERAIHFAILLKQHNFGHICTTENKRLFPQHSVVMSGVLGHHSRHKKSGVEKDTQELDQEMYMDILERLTVSLNKHPRSVPLALFMARIYLKKLENIPQAVGLIKRMSELDLSVPLRSSVEEFTHLLKKMYTNQYMHSDQSLNLINYFKYRKVANEMKTTILTEVKKHIEFWTEIKKDAIDVKQMFDIAREINNLSQKAETMFAHNQQDFSKTIANSLQVYKFYIEKVRELPHESAKLMKTFLTIRHNQMLRHPLDVCSEEKAVAVLSLQKDNVGTILDISGSLQTLFNVDKSKVIGSTLNSFLPGSFTKYHIQFIHNYAKVLTHKLDHKLKTYGKTREGELFELNMHMQLYPEIDKEVKMMILFEKLTGPLSIIIVDRDGAIVDYSDSVKSCFWSNVIGIGNKVQNFSPEYDVVNSAFNVVYGAGTGDIVSNYSNVKDKKERSTVTNMTMTLSKKKTMKTTSSGISTETAKILHDLKNKATIDNEAPDLEKAKQICNIYGIGARMVFDNSKTISDEGDEVQIEPYFHGNSVYKVITIKPPEEISKIVAKFETEAELKKTKTEALSDIFAEDFPEEDERVYPEVKAPRRDYRYTTDAANPMLIGGRTSANREATGLSLTKFTFPNDEKPSSKRLDSSVVNQPEDTSEGDEKVKGKKNTKQATSMQPAKAAMAQREMSVTSYLTSGLETIKALRRIFDQRSAYPLTRNTLIIVALLIGFMTGLATVFYVFSQNSITQHQNNIEIINIANQRLTSAIKAWQYATRYHLINIQLSFEDEAFVLKSLASSAQTMIEKNNELDQMLSTSLSESRLRDIFQNNIYLWEPCKGATATGDAVNSFTATSMLYNVLNALDELPKTCPDLLGGDDVLFVLNNTANDYLLSSESLIQVTRDVLKTDVNNKILNLELILIFQSIALVILCVFLIFVVRVIVQSYKRLFRALMKIEDFHINFRLEQLQNTKISLEIDIEDKKFGFENEVEEVKQRPKGMGMNKNKKQKTGGFITRDDRFSVNKLIIYLAKYVGVTLIFIVLPSVLFFVSLEDSISNFSILDTADDELSLTNQEEYAVRMLMTNFYFQILFQNSSSVFIRNELPIDQLSLNLDTMNSLHTELLTVFFEGGDTIDDPVIESMLKDTVCSWLPTDDATLNELCPVATKGNEIGVISLDSNLIMASTTYIKNYLNNPTLDYANSTITDYQKEVRSLMVTLEGAYKFLNNHILEHSLSEVALFKERTTYLFLGILATIALSACVIYFMSIKQFTFLDMGRGKILKLIPYHFITENKALDFYLNKDFDKKKYSIKGM